MKLLQSFCGVAFIMMFFIIINASASPPGTDSWGSTNNDAEFNADVYCLPKLSVTGGFGGVGGIAGANSYTKLLGNYFAGFVGDISPVEIVFTLEGPGLRYDNTHIGYSVMVTKAQTSDGEGMSYATITAHWSISSGNVNTTTQGDGFWYPPPQIWLQQNPDYQNDNCKWYATFTISALHLDLSHVEIPSSTGYVTEQFSFVVEASANI